MERGKKKKKKNKMKGTEMKEGEEFCSVGVHLNAIRWSRSGGRTDGRTDPSDRRTIGVLLFRQFLRGAELHLQNVRLKRHLRECALLKKLGLTKSWN